MNYILLYFFSLENEIKFFILFYFLKKGFYFFYFLFWLTRDLTSLLRIPKCNEEIRLT